MIKFLTSAFVLSGILLFTVPVFATSYLYVDKNGEVGITTASNPTEAINNTPDIAPHSGVMLVEVTDNGTSVPTAPAGKQVYRYVDKQGLLQTQFASSPQEAMAIAPNIAMHSGVWLISN